ncbi:MAG: aldehyde dehydrogenase family protein [Dehalococcoidia bacterium]
MKTFDVVSPMTGQKVASYTLMDAKEVDAAVARARSTLVEWSGTPVKDRMKILARAAEILADNALFYAERISDENGKTRFDALMADVYPSCDIMHYYAQNAAKFLAPVNVPRIGCYHSEIGIRAFTNIKSITECKNGNKKEFYQYPAMDGAEQGLLDALRFMYTQSTSQKIKSFFKVAPFLLKMQSEGKKQVGC